MRDEIMATVLALTTLFGVTASGQDAKQGDEKDATCQGPVYERKEVSRLAKYALPVVGVTDEAQAKTLDGVVSLTVVFCRTGHVTDIQVVKGLPYGMTERVVEAMRSLKFVPAEKDGQAASQRQRIEYHFRAN